MSARVLFLAADSLDKDLVLRWADDGTLPTFRRLLATAAWGVSENPPGLFVGAVWPSFWTSVSPARHARYCFEQLRPGSYEKVRIHPTDTQAPPFWDMLSRAGRRIAIIDVPKTYVAENLNGVHVVDWGTHDPDYKEMVTWPASLAATLTERYGHDEVGNCNTHGRAGEYEKLRDQLIARVARKKQMILDTLASEKWDAVLGVFSESHCVGHQCWHLHDPNHARHDRALAARIGNPVRDIYVAIDAAIGEIIDKAGAGTDVIVLGSHGMRSHYDATFLLDHMLRRIEGTRATAGMRATARTEPSATSIARKIWLHTPLGIRRLLKPIKDPVKARIDPSPLASRKYFSMPNNDAYGAIRLNLVGREPNGRVARADFDSVCQSLERDLLAFKNVETGEPVVLRVWRANEFYRGPLMDHLPDLIVEWNRDTPVSRIYSEKTGEISGTYQKCRTGDHSANGIFFMSGEGAAAGPVSRNISIMDIGPTMAERLGVTLQDVDGRSFADLVFPRGSSGR
ncbi:MAG TPA: alkaline phosphatase family protein, partial [Candidatus Krumholzibacteria bacterium]|nr:alkaline phosphatase family protein [Candidatus Krumholzibacteria bacterium]